MKRVTWITLILGIWLIASPVALGHAATTAAAANDVIFGILLLAGSGWILAGLAQPILVNWFEVLCSIWLCAAPYALHYERLSHAMTNDVGVGIMTLLVGLVEAWTLMLEPVHG